MITKEELLKLTSETLEARNIFRKKEQALTIKLMQYLKHKGITDIYPIVGSWECTKSPIGLCIYNDLVDTLHDDCIFCHKPDERY